MEELVHARGLGRRYGRNWALQDLDLDVSSGEAVVLLGANGAGKSTLLTLLATLQRASRGTLHLFGEDPYRHSERVRRRVGYVAHATLLDDALTAQENLEYYAGLFGVANAERSVGLQLERAGLTDRRHDRVEGFSRGMRQRLSLARALLHEPELLILDEPFTGLDAPGCRDLAARLADEKQRGRALVLATHQLERVLEWCDRAVVLHRGRRAEEAPATGRTPTEWAVRLAEIAEDRA